MKIHDHNTKRTVFWLVIALSFAAGLFLLFYLPNHRISAGLALGVVALLALKHVGLFLVVGSPLTGLLQVARVRLRTLWRKHGHGGG